MSCVFVLRLSHTGFNDQPLWFRKLIRIISAIDIAIACWIYVCVIVRHFLPTTCTFPRTRDLFSQSMRILVWMLLNPVLRYLAVVLTPKTIWPHPAYWKSVSAICFTLALILLLYKLYQPNAETSRHCDTIHTTITQFAMVLLSWKASHFWIIYIGNRLTSHYGEDHQVMYGRGFEKISTLQYEGEISSTHVRVYPDNIRLKANAHLVPHVTRCETLDVEEQDEWVPRRSDNVLKSISNQVGLTDRHGCPAFHFPILDRFQFSTFLATGAMMMSLVYLASVFACGETLLYDIQEITFANAAASTTWLAVLYLPTKKAVKDDEAAPKLPRTPLILELMKGKACLVLKKWLPRSIVCLRKYR